MQELPQFAPVECKIAEKYLGDVMMVLQFASSFSKVLQTNKFFPGGLTLELMERALTENEVNKYTLLLIKHVYLVHSQVCSIFNTK